MPTPNSDFLTILQTLARHEVDMVVVGGVCAVLHGTPTATFDLDVVHSRAEENLGRLLAALQELQAYYREQPQRRLTPGRSHLLSPGHQLLTTPFGYLDLLGTISDDLSYQDLLPHTVIVQVNADFSVRMLDLPTLIEIKEKAGRDKDRAVLPTLRRTLEEKAKLNKPSDSR